ncbi:MAG: SDR family oxidoreductase [Nostoc sp.]|uniref:SDR family oxidoreductase n=1 Tax=Nostoc sp. TaxID=1180 RepID=UPI002FF5FE95
MDIKRSGSQPSTKGSAEYFTGTVRIDPLFKVHDPARAIGASVTFEPGARTAWHTHPLGQTLIVTGGCGLAQRWGGAIVNTSSGAGIIGIKGSPAYTAAKHGVIGLTKAAALDYAAQNIRVNAVCPGYIDTPMMGRFTTGGTDEGRAKVIAEEPIRRMGKPEEIAAAVVWLCSDTAAFIVGHAMVIDGGQTV